MTRERIAAARLLAGDRVYLHLLHDQARTKFRAEVILVTFPSPAKYAEVLVMKDDGGTNIFSIDLLETLAIDRPAGSTVYNPNHWE